MFAKSAQNMRRVQLKGKYITHEEYTSHGIEDAFRTRHANPTQSSRQVNARARDKPTIPLAFMLKGCAWSRSGLEYCSLDIYVEMAEAMLCSVPQYQQDRVRKKKKKKGSISRLRRDRGGSCRIHPSKSKSLQFRAQMETG